MDGFIEEAFASARGGLAMAGILFAVGDHASSEHARPIVGGITAAIEVEIGVSQVHTDRCGDLLQGLQPLRSRTISVSLTGATGRELTHRHGCP